MLRQEWRRLDRNQTTISAPFLAATTQPQPGKTKINPAFQKSNLIQLYMPASLSSLDGVKNVLLFSSRCKPLISFGVARVEK